MLSVSTLLVGEDLGFPPFHFENRIASRLVVSNIDVMPLGHFSISKTWLWRHGKNTDVLQLPCFVKSTVHPFYCNLLGLCWRNGISEFLTSTLQDNHHLNWEGGGRSLKDMFLVKICPWFFHFPLTTCCPQATEGVILTTEEDPAEQSEEPGDGAMYVGAGPSSITQSFS